MFDTPEHEMEFLVNSNTKIRETYNLCIILRKKYNTTLKNKSLSPEMRKEIEEKVKKNEEEIAYYEKAFNYIANRKIYVQGKIEEFAQRRKEREMKEREKKDN